MNKTEYILWGVAIGQPNYREEILFVNSTVIDAANEKLIELARSKGYDRLRVSKVDLSKKPNFLNTIN